MCIPRLFLIGFFKAQNVERVDLEDFLKIVPWSKDWNPRGDTVDGWKKSGVHSPVEVGNLTHYFTGF